ncbi:MAG: hypothetical protein OXH14_02310 [Alphaproteobacteria bacterium]|nr:hypothetical protein [Alphaproteobacteria bacterium]
MRTLLAISFLLSASIAGAQTTPSPSAPVVGHGLSTQVLFVGADRSKNRVTVSVRITNTADSPAYLAIVSPAPTALDNRGGVYDVEKIAGIARCSHLHNSEIDNCIANRRGYLPGTTFSLLPPKIPTLVNIELQADNLQPGTSISFTMNAALARNTRPTNNRSDQSLPEYINLHFPLMPLK